jgi:hypothetical protein
LQYRDLAVVVLRILRDHRLSEPPKPTAVFVDMLDLIECCVHQLTADHVDQQTQLARLMWFGSDLRAKIYSDQKRIRRATLMYERLCGQLFSV